MHNGSTSSLTPASRTRSSGFTTLVRLMLASGIVHILATVALAQGTQSPATPQQPEVRALRQPAGRLIVPVTGTMDVSSIPSAPAEQVPPAPPIGSSTAAPPPTAPDADQASTGQVTGSFSIQRFASTTDGAVAAVGTMTVSFFDPSSGTARTIVTRTLVPVALPGDASTPGRPGIEPQPNGANAQTQPGASAAQPGCEALSLILQPLQLGLMGRQVLLDQVNVDFTVAPESNSQLGIALCGIAGLVQNSASPAERVKLLNSLLNSVG
jgi:hypothetical protein